MLSTRRRRHGGGNRGGGQDAMRQPAGVTRRREDRGCTPEFPPQKKLLFVPRTQKKSGEPAAPLTHRDPPPCQLFLNAVIIAIDPLWRRFCDVFTTTSRHWQHSRTGVLHARATVSLKLRARDSPWRKIAHTHHNQLRRRWDFRSHPEKSLSRNK